MVFILGGNEDYYYSNTHSDYISIDIDVNIDINNTFEIKNTISILKKYKFINTLFIFIKNIFIF